MAVWPDEYYVFRAVLGSLVVQMRVADGPGGRKPLKREIIHTSIHAQRPVLSSFWPLLSCFGAFSGCLAPSEAHCEVLEHGVALRGRLDVVWALS